MGDTLAPNRIKFAEDCKRSVFEQITDIVIDPKKKNILVFDKCADGEFTHTYGAGKLIKRELIKDYNVFTFWLGSASEPGHNQFRHNIHPRFFVHCDRKSETPDYITNNIARVNEKIKFIDDLPEFEFAVVIGNTDLVMPLTAYCSKNFDSELYNHRSEYFDYIGKDQSVIEKIEAINHDLYNDAASFIRRFSPYAISTCKFSIVFNLFKELYIRGKVKKYISFCTDPNFVRSFFQYHKIPHDFYYYADDNRGTRDFKKLDLAQLQQVYTNETLKNTGFDNWSTNERDLTTVFAGSIFHEKGPRTQIWNEFLRDYQDPNARYFIPIKKNGIVRKEESDDQINMVKERFADIYEEVSSHCSIRKFMQPSQLEAELDRFKFGLVFRCVSVYDSLNPKPYQYVSHGVLPLFDSEYDKEYLYIPKEIKDALTIRNADDISRLVQMSEDDRQMHLNTLRKLFCYDDYINNTDEKIKQQYNIIINNLKV